MNKKGFERGVRRRIFGRQTQGAMMKTITAVPSGLTRPGFLLVLLAAWLTVLSSYGLWLIGSSLADACWSLLLFFPTRLSFCC